jgi:hypothetical protein
MWNRGVCRQSVFPPPYSLIQALNSRFAISFLHSGQDGGTMLETISIALLTYLGQKVIDSFWSRMKGGQRAVVDHTGRIGTTPIQSGAPLIAPPATLRTQSPMTGLHQPGQASRPPSLPDFRPPLDVPESVADEDELEYEADDQDEFEYEADDQDEFEYEADDQDEFEFVEVNVFLPPMMSYLQEENTVSVAMIISAENQEAVLAAVDLAQPFNAELPPGDYSFYTLVLDPNAANLLDSYTFAVGLPAKVNLANFEEFTIGDFEALLDIVSEEPLPVLPNEGPHVLDMVLLPLDELGLASSDDRRLGAILGMRGY